MPAAKVETNSTANRHKWYFLNDGNIENWTVILVAQHYIYLKSLNYTHETVSFIDCCCLVAQLCLILCNPMDCSPPGPSVHEISQARMLEWVAISSSRGSSQPSSQTHVFCIGRWILYHWATRKAILLYVNCT